MVVRKLDKTEKAQYPAMEFCITINNDDRFFTEKDLIELGTKIQEQLIKL